MQSLLEKCHQYTYLPHSCHKTSVCKSNAYYTKSGMPILEITWENMSLEVKWGDESDMEESVN